jgi:lipoprotein-releasing system permease protein
MTPGIFDWLDLQTMNELIILSLMVVVAAINMITALLILILERTNMIGIMKALGANNISIRRIFLYYSAVIIGVGLLAGNVFGIGLCLVQKYFHVIKLQQDSYYLSYAPVEMNWNWIVILNVGTIIITLLLLILPSILVSRISPVKAIRFE